MTYAIIKPGFDGVRRVGTIPCFDGTVPVLEGTDEERNYFPHAERMGYKVVEVDLPPNIGYYWEHYNALVTGEKQLWELGYGDPPEEPEPVKKKVTAKKKVQSRKPKANAKPEGAE